MSKNLAVIDSFKKPDSILLLILVIIILFGIVILASVSAPFAQAKYGNSYYFLKHQLLFGFLPGLVLAFFVFNIRLAFLKRIAPFLFLISLILMTAVFLPFIGSHQEGGASRWITFGHFSFQPSELLKLTFILYLATWLSGRLNHGQKFGAGQAEKSTRTKNANQTLLLFLVIVGVVSLFLIFQPNISTLGVIVLTGFLMYFSAGTPLRHSILMIVMGGVGLFSLIKMASYRVDRLLVFLNPDAYPMGIGYQIKHALIAVGSGGLTGVGLGMSSQKLGFLPQSIADSIFAVFSEETGFIGAFFLVLLFLLFFWRGFQIAKNAPDKFSQLTATGITCWIIVQTFVNIGSMIGILPLTGIPLPFFSYGGSALIMELIGVGVLLNISKHT